MSLKKLAITLLVTLSFTLCTAQAINPPTKAKGPTVETKPTLEQLEKQLAACRVKDKADQEKFDKEMADYKTKSSAGITAPMPMLPFGNCAFLEMRILMAREEASKAQFEAAEKKAWDALCPLWVTTDRPERCKDIPPDSVILAGYHKSCRELDGSVKEEKCAKLLPLPAAKKK